MSAKSRFQAPDLLSREEAAEIFGVSSKRLKSWEDSGRLTVVRLLSGHRRYRREDIAALVDEQVRAPAPDPEPVVEEPPAPPTRLAIRRTALDALHAGDVTGGDPREALPADAPEYAKTLVDGVHADRETIDGLISGASEHWTIERMPVVDRNILRIAIFELLHTDVPTGAIVDQAVRLAKLLSTEGSGRFVNGILGTIARAHR